MRTTTNDEEQAIIMKDCFVRFMALAGMYSAESIRLLDMELKYMGGEPEERALIEQARVYLRNFIDE